MPIPARHKEYENCPEGLHSGVCVDVVDLGWQESKNPLYSGGYKVRFVFAVEVRDEAGQVVPTRDGHPRWFVGRTFYNNLGAKSQFRAFLENWAGKRDWSTCDLESYLGKPGQVTVEHNVTPQATFANIKSVSRLAHGMTPVSAPPDFVRACNRPGFAPPAEPAPSRSANDVDTFNQPDSDLPF